MAGVVVAGAAVGEDGAAVGVEDGDGQASMEVGAVGVDMVIKHIYIIQAQPHILPLSVSLLPATDSNTHWTFMNVSTFAPSPPLPLLSLSPFYLFDSPLSSPLLLVVSPSLSSFHCSQAFLTMVVMAVLVILIGALMVVTVGLTTADLVAMAVMVDSKSRSVRKSLSSSKTHTAHYTYTCRMHMGATRVYV